MTVYLLHFDTPISPDHTCQHYVGFTDQLRRRMEQHASGHGARLLAVAHERGIGWSLVRTWPRATRADERRIKQSKFANRLCPVCSPTSRRGLALASGWRRPTLRRPGIRFWVPSTSSLKENAR